MNPENHDDILRKFHFWSLESGLTQHEKQLRSIIYEALRRVSRIDTDPDAIHAREILLSAIELKKSAKDNG